MCTLLGNLFFFFMSHLMQVLRESFEVGRDLYKIFAGGGTHLCKG